GGDCDEDESRPDEDYAGAETDLVHEREEGGVALVDSGLPDDLEAEGLRPEEGQGQPSPGPVEHRRLEGAPLKGSPGQLGVQTQEPERHQYEAEDSERMGQGPDNRCEL